MLTVLAILGCAAILAGMIIADRMHPRPDQDKNEEPGSM